MVTYDDTRRKRDQRGRPWLNDIEAEAEQFNLSLREATDIILEYVAERKIVRDILSGKGEARYERLEGLFAANDAMHCSARNVQADEIERLQAIILRLEAASSAPR